MLPVNSSLAQISLQIPRCCRMQTTIKVAILYNKSAHCHVKFPMLTASATTNSSFLDVTPHSLVNSTRLNGVTSTQHCILLLLINTVQPHQQSLYPLMYHIPMELPYIVQVLILTVFEWKYRVQV